MGGRADLFRHCLPVACRWEAEPTCSAIAYFVSASFRDRRDSDGQREPGGQLRFWDGRWQTPRLGASALVGDVTRCAPGCGIPCGLFLDCDAPRERRYLHVLATALLGCSPR
ncbi:hypothetical protein ACFL5O_12340, partial [Myxococcota bacterium]